MTAPNVPEDYWTTLTVCPTCGEHWKRRETFSNTAERADTLTCPNAHQWQRRRDVRAMRAEDRNAPTIPLRFAEPSAIAFTYDAGAPVAGDPIAPTSKYAVVREDGALVVPSHGEWPHEAEPLTPDDRIDLARVALHGQPFGPTPEMLAFLDNPGQFMDAGGWFDADGERILRATAAFVRAMLVTL